MANFKGQADRYFEETTVHGFSYVHSRNTCCAKVFWGAVIITGFVVAGFMIANMLEDWDNNPTITTLDSIAVPVAKVQFPTVTICPVEDTPPDRWAVPELIYNSLAYESYQSFGYEFPSLNKSEKARNDFRPIIRALYQKFKSWIRNNQGQIVPGHPLAVDIMDTFIADTTKAIIEGKLTRTDVQNALVETFGIYEEASSAYELPTDDYDYYYDGFFSASSPCPDLSQDECDRRMNEVQSDIYPGMVLVTTARRVPLGSVLTQFLTLVNTITLDTRKLLFEVFNNYYDYCIKFPPLEAAILDQMTLMSDQLGLNDSKLPVFDVPVLLSKLEALNFWPPSETTLSVVALGSHCNYGLDLNQMMKKCANAWSLYETRYPNYPHPCDSSPLNKTCCHFWTDAIQHNLKAAMKIMRVASRRGQTYIDIVNFLKDFQGNIAGYNAPTAKYKPVLSYNFNRYPMNKYGFGGYRVGNIPDGYAFDPTGYMVGCKYALHKECPGFKPAITDIGLCYSFNGKDIKDQLQPSLFKEAVLETYSTELSNDTEDIIMGSGPGPDLSLIFQLDNNLLYRPHTDSYSFKVAMGSQPDVLQIKRTGKIAKPGYFMKYEVYPMEVTASETLKHVPVAKRGCRFPNEIKGVLEIFSEYSQSACQFECMLRLSRQFCRCTPWNLPFPPGEDHVMCDLYGHSCFNAIMKQQHRKEECSCLPGCNSVKFTVSEKETKIVGDYCLKDQAIGKLRYQTKSNQLGSTMLSVYRAFPKYFDTLSKGEPNDTSRFKDRECFEMMNDSIVFFEVNFGSDTYVRTIMDQRVTFTDQLGSFGGTLGLFTGMSLLSMIEVAFWLFRMVGNLLKPPARKKTLVV